MLAFGIGVMINRDSRGHSYFIVRGEILGFMKDEQLRKHLPSVVNEGFETEYFVCLCILLLNQSVPLYRDYKE